MSAEDALARPLGWWLKEADRRIERAFQAAFEGAGVDRRRWQVIASIARGPASQADIAAALKGFDDCARIDAVINELIDRGWVEPIQDRLRLTRQGAEIHGELAARVDEVRERVIEALPDEDYVTLIHLLARLVGGLEDETRAS